MRIKELLNECMIKNYEMTLFIGGKMAKNSSSSSGIFGYLFVVSESVDIYD